MPVIYRPDTDTQRVQALQTAKAKYDGTAAAERAFSASTYAALDAFLPDYLAKLSERGIALSNQSSVTSKANPVRRSTRLYVSHFIMSFNMAVLREEFSPTDRAYYQLDVSSDSVPKLTTDEDLVQWAANIQTGEAARVAAGGDAMANPSAAQVADQMTILAPLLTELSTNKDAYDNAQQNVEALRATADEIIADAWDEVLFTFRKDDAPSMRRKAREYGVVYKPSKGEDPSADEFSAKGQVTDQTTLEPLSDVTVEIVELGQSTTTDVDGRYIFGLQPDGAYTMRFSRAGYKTAILPFVITAGSIATLDVKLAMGV